MQNQLSQKKASTEDLEQQVSGDLDKQEANVKQQTELYKAQTL